MMGVDARTRMTILASHVQDLAMAKVLDSAPARWAHAWCSCITCAVPPAWRAHRDGIKSAYTAAAATLANDVKADGLLFIDGEAGVEPGTSCFRQHWKDPHCAAWQTRTLLRFKGMLQLSADGAYLETHDGMPVFSAASVDVSALRNPAQVQPGTALRVSAKAVLLQPTPEDDSALVLVPPVAATSLAPRSAQAITAGTLRWKHTTARPTSLAHVLGADFSDAAADLPADLPSIRITCMPADSGPPGASTDAFVMAAHPATVGGTHSHSASATSVASAESMAAVRSQVQAHPGSSKGLAAFMQAFQ